MEADAETLFDYLGKRYEDAFADSPNLCGFVEQAARKLTPHSKVLDIGCGTGRPVAHTLAAAGHQVHGVDVSQTMVDIASNQVSGTFIKMDMREYEPESPFDGIFAILSLFQFTPGELHSMCYKFAEWLNPSGYVVLGVTPSTSLPADSYIYDPTWDCARQMEKPWMDKYTKETFFSEKGWKLLLQSAGFAIESDVFYTFTPNDSKHKNPEDHLLLLAKKIEKQPLLGPYPLPKERLVPLPTTADCFSDRLESDGMQAMLKSFNGERVLSLGHIDKRNDGATIEEFDGPLDALPFSDGEFDIVLVLWRLDSVTDMNQSLHEVLRVTKKTSTSQIVIIQGAPHNELSQFRNTTPSLPKTSHQGQVLSTAVEILAGKGFADAALSRIDGKYMFLEERVEERCAAACNLLSAGRFMNDTSELISRLELHFRGSKHSIDASLVMLRARLLPN